MGGALKERKLPNRCTENLISKNQRKGRDLPLGGCWKCSLGREPERTHGSPTASQAMVLTWAVEPGGRRQASHTARWGGHSFLGRILLWTQSRQQLPTVWKQTVKQSRLLRLQHPIKCNLNQASHLFSIPFSLCFPSAFGQSSQLRLLTLVAPDTF